MRRISIGCTPQIATYFAYGDWVVSEDEKAGLGVALNEAALLDVRVNASTSTVLCVLEVLTLPETGPAPEDRAVGLYLRPVGRIVASLREGRWDDPAAGAVPLSIDDLSSTVRSFGGMPIYGWEFIDPPDEDWAHWQDRLSLDVTLSEDRGLAHVLDLFQEQHGDQPRHLDLRIWFDELFVGRRDGQEVPMDQFIADGERWWNGLYAGDARTQGYGIVPGRSS